ncbi:MAG: hypothetical protein OSB44_11885, partial [Verrucomicrobiales bacterium]|nr:hypothetical protein [Verrucomicrobiales bacterium]
MKTFKNIKFAPFFALLAALIIIGCDSKDDVTEKQKETTTTPAPELAPELAPLTAPEPAPSDRVQPDVSS